MYTNDKEGKQRLYRKGLINAHTRRICVLFITGAYIFSLFAMVFVLDSIVHDGKITFTNIILDNPIIILICILLWVIIVINFGNVKIECEMYNYLEVIYDSGLDQWQKIRYMIQYIESYTCNKEIDSRDIDYFGTIRKEYSLNMNIITLKAEIKRRTTEFTCIMIFQLVISIASAIIKYPCLGISDTIAEVVFYCMIVFIGIIIALKYVDESKKNKFILEVVDQTEKRNEKSFS